MLCSSGCLFQCGCNVWIEHAGNLRVSLCASHTRALSGAGGARLIHGKCEISANASM